MTNTEMKIIQDDVTVTLERNVIYPITIHIEDVSEIYMTRAEAEFIVSALSRLLDRFKLPSPKPPEDMF